MSDNFDYMNKPMCNMLKGFAQDCKNWTLDDALEHFIFTCNVLKHHYFDNSPIFSIDNETVNEHGVWDGSTGMAFEISEAEYDPKPTANKKDLFYYLVWISKDTDTGELAVRYGGKTCTEFTTNQIELIYEIMTHRCLGPYGNDERFENDYPKIKNIE